VILLVSGATATLRQLPTDAPIGHLATPANGNRLAGLMATGRPVALDNGCGPRQDGTPGALDEATWLAMCQESSRLDESRILVGSPIRSQLLWAVCPDAVGDAAETLRLWKWYHGWLRSLRLPPAFVAQDGAEELYIPWEKLTCLFLGGSTAYKESEAARWLLMRAKQHGKLVHIGRVNSERRLRLFDHLGRDVRTGMPYAIDSLDGTQFSMFPDRYIPRWAERLQPRVPAQLHRAPTPMEDLWS
jgi:hypothetical protein